MARITNPVLGSPRGLSPTSKSLYDELAALDLASVDGAQALAGDLMANRRAIDALYAALDEYGHVDAAGKPSPLLKELRSHEALQTQLMHALMLGEDK